MPTLRIAGQSLVFPRACACCLERDTQTVSTSAERKLWLGVATVTRTLTLQIPYCDRCAPHARWAEKGSGNTWGGGCVVFLFGIVAASFGYYAVWEALGPQSRLTSAVQVVAFLLPFVAATAWIRWRLGKKPLVQGGRHATQGHAVSIGDFTADSVTLEMANAAYADRLAEANGLAKSAQTPT